MQGITEFGEPTHHLEQVHDDWDGLGSTHG